MKNFLEIIAKLRSPNGGCPWDLAQNFTTMIPHLLEECYETVDALQNQDWQNLQEELGDLLLQIVFISQLAKEQKLFDFNDVLDGITNKMIRRHPHVFGEKKAKNEKQALDNWNAIKDQEKTISISEESSILDNIPKAFPALTRAEKIQQRCAKIGFDWERYQGAMNKVKEELAEVQVELNSSHINQSSLQSEIGDLLFACVNLARHLNFSAEETLRQANIKFEKRFRNVEKLAKSQNQQLQHLSIVEMDKLWEIVKNHEK